MPKTPCSGQKQSYISNSQDMLKRRPIHPETEHLEENKKKKYQDNSNNSPEKSKRLYPELPNDHEVDDSREKVYDRNDLHHRYGVVDETDLQNMGGESLPEKAKKSHKGNEVKYLKENFSDVSRTSTSFNDNCPAYFKWLLFLFLLVVISGSLFVSLKVQKPAAELPLREKLKNMQSIFKDQHSLTFRLLENALKKVVSVTEEPSAPAIFTVTANKNAVYKSHEFSHYLAENLAPQRIVLINESVSWQSDPDNIKLKIDNKIKSAAENEDLFVVIIDNLQNMPPKGAMIFHSYCDHEAAPFKQAVFLFIVPLDEVLPKETTSKKIDSAAFQKLKKIWNYASSDEIDSLITRITVNVINIR